MTNTVQLHRVLTTTPEKIWRAFTQRRAFGLWLPPDGFVGNIEKLEAKKGGAWRGSFTNFTTGNEMFFGGNYTEFKANEIIAYTCRFDDPNMPGEMTNRITIKAVSMGTEIQITQSGIPAMIPTEACYLGWQQSLLNLARIVEPNIPQ